MGYRHYFYRANKEDVERVRDLTYKQLIRLCKKRGCGYERDEWENGEVEEHINVHKFLSQVEVFGFGKYYENAEEIQKKSEPLFLKKGTAKYFADYDIYVCGKEALECAINWQVEKIKSYFETLLWSDSELAAKQEAGEVDPGLTQVGRLRAHVLHKKHEWDTNRLLPFSLDRERDMIQSWLYEYTIFALVKLHREMDWEQDCLLFYGW